MMMGEASREAQRSIAASSMFPGFRFSPTDQELISYYLKKKLRDFDKCAEVISEVEICKHEPWDLPAKSVIQSDNEWFFFSPRGRKYPNGLQSKRATELGYWKATGKERNVKSGPNVIGTKRTLVFHTGRAPKGERTEWIMHEYCMSGMSQDSLVVCRLRKSSEFRLNDSPKQGSLSRRHLPTENNSNFSLSEAGVEQLGILEAAKPVKCSSKECSNPGSCHSAEQQIDYGSESDKTLKCQFSQPGHQGCDEEDYYADILKDDIVDLENIFPRISDPMTMVADKLEDETRSQQLVQTIPLRVIPFQGTANRRIRMRWSEKQKIYHAAELVEVEANGKNYSIEGSKHLNLEQKPKCLMGILSDQRLNRRSISVVIVLIILTLLFLFVSLLGVPWQVQKFTNAFFL
ncbi:unnamed protein product [Camellia sinensis]